MNEFDVAIIGGGPAGMQAALSLARARKRTIVFDAPSPPRNAASHGVHNMLGLDGLLPGEIRTRAWEQIGVYGYAERREQKVDRVLRSPHGEGFELYTSEGSIWASRVLAAFGYRDLRPALDGFDACWGKTVIPCPFCDGYENVDRVWGVVPTKQGELEMFPRLAVHWASEVKLIVGPEIHRNQELEEICRQRGVELHFASIRELHHDDGVLHAVTLDTGNRVPLGTLLWQPPSAPLPLLEAIVEDLELELLESGEVPSDEHQQTNVRGLYVAGDLQGWAGGIGAAAAGNIAALHIVKSW